MDTEISATIEVYIIFYELEKGGMIIEMVWSWVLAWISQIDQVGEASQEKGQNVL